MRAYFIVIIISTAIVANSFAGEVYWVTQNTKYDYNPKIVLDSTNKLWCAWQQSIPQNQVILEKYFHNGIWSAEETIDTTLSNFDIDPDAQNNIWIGTVIEQNDEFKLFCRIPTSDSFEEKISYNYPYISEYISIAAYDSQNVWIDPHDFNSWYIMAYFFFNGDTITAIDTSFNDPFFSPSNYPSWLLRRTFINSTSLRAAYIMIIFFMSQVISQVYILSQQTHLDSYLIE